MGANVLTIVSDVFPESRRATAMGVVMSSFSVASIVGIYVGLEIAEHFGWRGPVHHPGALMRAGAAARLVSIASPAEPYRNAPEGAASVSAKSFSNRVICVPMRSRGR